MFAEGKNTQRRLEQDGQRNFSESRKQWRNHIDFYKSLARGSVPADVAFGMQTVLYEALIIHGLGFGMHIVL